MEAAPLQFTHFSDIAFSKRGKVRDIYGFEGALLIVSRDRISYFDVVLPVCILTKGRC